MESVFFFFYCYPRGKESLTVSRNVLRWKVSSQTVLTFLWRETLPGRTDSSWSWECVCLSCSTQLSIKPATTERRSKCFRFEIFDKMVKLLAWNWEKWLIYLKKCTIFLLWIKKMMGRVYVTLEIWGITFGGEILSGGTAGEQCHQSTTCQLLQRVLEAPPLKALRSTIKRGTREFIRNFSHS